MYAEDAIRDLCQWDVIVFASQEAHDRARRLHRQYHDRKATEAHIVRAVLHRMNVGVRWSDLSERERQIMRAYGAGADLL